jgi:hypothetical protein
MGVTEAPGGMVNANRLLRVGVGLLTAGGGPSGGVGCLGASDVSVARCLTLSGGLLSLGCGSLGGHGSWAACSEWWSWSKGGRAPSSTPLELVWCAQILSLSSPVDLLLCPVSRRHPTLSHGRIASNRRSLKGCESAGCLVLLHPSC